LGLNMRLPTINALLALVPGIWALGQSPTISLTGGRGDLKLAGDSINGQILLSANDWWGVIRAAQDLAGDVGKVTGKNLTLGNWRAPGHSADIVASPEDGQHVATETHGGETTILYAYNPTANFINVSLPRIIVWAFKI
jgi:hypothetical protein